MFRRILLAAVLAAALSVAGCTTTHGASGNIHIKARTAGKGPDKVQVKTNPAGTFVKVHAKNK